MIISHQHRFIFIHGPKTAGTSIADALIPFCGPDDIIVQHRSHGLNKHEGSEGIREFAGEDVWNSYFKFTFERNPWDKMVSLYCMQIDPDHWRRRDVGAFTRLRDRLRRRRMAQNPPSFRQWLLRKHRGLLHSGLPTYLGKLYFTEGPLAADHFGRFEKLQEDFRTIAERIGVEADLGGGDRRQRRKADPDFDPDTPAYRKYYDEELQEIVRQAYEKEIAFFNYEF